MSQLPRRFAAVIGAAGLLVGAVVASASASAGETGSRHVLLLSVDGLHQTDLDWYIEQHPASALARLAHRGVDYTHARTPIPSDSFPGMLAQVTGGNPASTGIYYDDSYNHALLPAGTTTCTPGQPTGAEVAYTEALGQARSVAHPADCPDPHTGRSSTRSTLRGRKHIRVPATSSRRQPMTTSCRCG